MGWLFVIVAVALIVVMAYAGYKWAESDLKRHH